jgi:hypothetical protein
MIKKIYRDGVGPPLPPEDSTRETPVLPTAEVSPFVANMDRHRARFTGGKLFLRELTYAIHLSYTKDQVVLPHLRLEVHDDLPVWTPPRVRRRRKKSPIPGLSRKQYLDTLKLKRWMRRLIAVLAGERLHLRVLMVQGVDDAPLSWYGRCESCGATFEVHGVWADLRRLPVMGGSAFIEECGAPDREILERVIVPRTRPKRQNWLRLRRIAPAR